MKKQVYFLTFAFIGSVAFAQNLIVEKDKAAALAACDKKAAGSPASEKDKMSATCRCVVNKVDFEKIKALSAEGKNADIQALYEKASKSCPAQ